MPYTNLDDLVEQTRTVITKLSTPCPRAVVWDPKLARHVDNSNAVAAWLREQLESLSHDELMAKLSTPCPRAVVWDPKLARHVDNSNAVVVWHLERCLANQASSGT